MAFFLVVAVLLVPLNSVARDLSLGTAPAACACQLVPTDRGADGSEEQSDQNSGENNDDCCDSEECCPDAAVPPVVCEVKANISGKQLYHPDTTSHIPTVYLSIFVPPER